MKPEIGLYIPSYNSVHYLSACLEGVKAQSYQPKDVVVVDDGSTDDVEAVVSKFTGVRSVRHSTNKGLSAARNTGIASLDTEWIASLDADTVPAKDWLATLASHLGAEARLAGVGGKLIERYTDTLADAWRARHLMQQSGDIPREISFLYGNNNVYRKQALVEVGFYNPKYRTNYEDADLCQRLTAAGWRLIYDPSATVEHLRRDTVLSIIDTYWRWHCFGYYKPVTLFYTLRDMFGSKAKATLKLTRQDFSEKNYHFIYVDARFLLHTFHRDIAYYLKNRKDGAK